MASEAGGVKGEQVDYKEVVQLLFEVADVCPITLSPDFGGNSMTVISPRDHTHIGTPGDGPLEQGARELRDCLLALKRESMDGEILREWYKAQKAIYDFHVQGNSGKTVESHPPERAQDE